MIGGQKTLLSTTSWPSSWTATGLTSETMFGASAKILDGASKWLATGDIFWKLSPLEIQLVGGPLYSALVQKYCKKP